MTLNAYKFTNYKILNKLSENLFTWDWTLGEEIKLLGAIERLGLNNWEEISKILGKVKQYFQTTKIISHYFRSRWCYQPNHFFYLSGRHNPKASEGTESVPLCGMVDHQDRLS